MKSLLHLLPESLDQLGIVDWGYTEESNPRSFDSYETWVMKDLHKPLDYLSDHRKNLRSDLKMVYPNFQSSLVFLFSYRPTKKWMLENKQHTVASYALGFEGEDYHFALKRKLDLIANWLKEAHPELEHFISLDAQPVLERDLAYRAGLGWFGKNSMLINQREGSYFIIGSLLLNRKLSLETRRPDVDHCGQCTACIDACPTNAIDSETRTLKAQDCISTFTIETFKDVLPPEGLEKSRGEIFGCDICQDVCPWNRKPLDRTEAYLKLSERFSFLKNWFFQWSRSELISVIHRESNRGLKRMLAGTPFDRPGREGWLKNLKHRK
jgi:epoxyqueuosine reductase